MTLLIIHAAALAAVSAMAGALVTSLVSVAAARAELRAMSRLVDLAHASATRAHDRIDRLECQRVDRD